VKLIEALNICRREAVDGPPLRVALVTGFSPLHVETFLHAQLRVLFPQRRVEIVTGSFGDVSGSLRNVKDMQLDAVGLVLEWEDLDPRLGIRQLGGWSVEGTADVLVQAKIGLSLLQTLIEEIARSLPVAVSLPTLPLPPLFFTPGWQTSEEELILRSQLSAFAAAIGRSAKVRLVNEQRLSLLSPFAGRLDVKAAWTAGFPYQLSHASAVAELLADLIQNRVAKKGLITDLDNTLWRGIVGELGADKVHWDLDNHSQGHGLYQQFLSELADEGVLIAAASKNERSVVDQAFARPDILLQADRVFPFEVSWGSKANAVSTILARWNIGPDSVVFVDDDPLELAEVQSMHPEVTGLQFPKNDPQAINNLLVHLRDLFGKRSVSEEDKLRLQSIRANAEIQAASDEAEGFSEALLERAEAELTLDLSKNLSDSRALELINKTNQFNLNGLRMTEGEWHNHLSQEDTFLLTASYRDRFGSLGKIAVITGRKNHSKLRVESWVMSCRAFARRVEHQCLQYLYSKFDTDTITFDYAKTERNGPLTRFFNEVLGEQPAATVELTREHFEAHCPRLFHQVQEIEANGCHT
jgi:FkbH-like protein